MTSSGVAANIDLLAGGHRCDRRRARSVGARRLARAFTDDLDRAFADGNFDSAGPDVDIESRADGADPGIPGADPERALGIVSDLEEGLAAVQVNDPRTRTVLNVDPAVGIEIERRPIRKSHIGLLTDGGLEAGILVLQVVIPAAEQGVNAP